MTDNPLSGKVSLDITEFRSGISQLNREIRLVDTGFKASAASLGDWADSATGLEMRIEALNKQIDLQRQKVSATRQMYEQLAREKGENSRVAQDMQIRLNRETEALGKLEHEAKQAGSALEKMKNQTDAAGKSTQTLGKKVQDTKVPLSGLKGQLGDVVEGLTGLNLGAVTAAGAVLGLANQVKQSVSAYTDYVDEMRKVSSAIGVNVEDVSRLIMAGDDLRISQESITKALEKAVEQGFVPSIENLAQLADELREIQDPVERADLLYSKFGRNWREIVPLLEEGGDAIRAATKEVSNNLVVTDEAVQKTNEYKLALDNLGDAWLGVQNAFAKNQLPGLTGSLKIFADNIEDLSNGVSVFEVLAENQRRYALLEYEISDAAQAYTARMRGQADAHQRLNEAMQGANDNALAGQYAMQQYFAVLESQTVAQAASQIEQLKGMMGELTTAQQNAKTAMEELATAQQNWQQGAGSDAARALEQAGIKGERYEQALQVIDETMGTGLYTQHKYTEEQGRLAAEFAKTGDLAAYEQGLKDLEAAYMPLEESVANARAELEKFMLMWDQLKSKHVQLKFEITGGSGKGRAVTPGTVTAPTEMVEEERAAGGPVVRGHTYLVGEDGPEVVKMPGNGYVYNADRTREMLGGPATHIQITQVFQVPGDYNQAKRGANAGVLAALRVQGAA
jgi:chromosome segregation ATPase